MENLKMKVEKILRKKEEKDNKLIQDFMIKPDLALISCGRVSEQNPPIEPSVVMLMTIDNNNRHVIAKQKGRQAVYSTGDGLKDLDYFLRLVVDKRDIDDPDIFLFTKNDEIKLFSCDQDIQNDSQLLPAQRMKVLMLIFSTQDKMAVYYFNNLMPVPFSNVVFNISGNKNDVASLFCGTMVQVFPELENYLRGK